MIRRPPRSTQGVSSAASDVYKRQSYNVYMATGTSGFDNGKNISKTSYSIELEPDVQLSLIHISEPTRPY